jgi:voltage-gated potassium channel
MSAHYYRRFVWCGLILLLILVTGTAVYWFIGGGQYSPVDTLYMTFITIATIGYGEVVDLTGNPGGRIFTMCIAVTGIGVLGYAATNLAALLVEGELTKSFKRRRMENTARKSSGHFVVCGVGTIGLYILNELHSTRRGRVVIGMDKAGLERIQQSFKDEIVIEGDATNDDTLLKAGIGHAQGLFAVTGDDNQNLVISLTAKQLNPHLRVVAECNEVANGDKMKKAGADAVVSSSLIGGLRMASEMMRPTVVSFLDIMLRDTDKNLRVEEIRIPPKFVGRTISDLKLRSYRHSLLLAVKKQGDWVYNPPDDHRIESGNTLVLMTTPEGRTELEALLGAE